MQYEPLERLKFPVRDFILRHAHGPYATWFLALVSVIEATVSPLPIEAVLGPLVIARPHRWWFYAAVATIASVLGALIGYGIGLALYESVAAPIIELYGFDDEIARTTVLLRDNMFLATFLAAFTPAPYKVFVFIAGLLHGPLTVFILASFVGRGARFLIFAVLARYFGGAIARLVFRYFTLATVGAALIALIALALVLI